MTNQEHTKLCETVFHRDLDGKEYTRSEYAEVLSSGWSRLRDLQALEWCCYVLGLEEQLKTAHQNYYQSCVPNPVVASAGQVNHLSRDLFLACQELGRTITRIKPGNHKLRNVALRQRVEELRQKVQELRHEEARIKAWLTSLSKPEAVEHFRSVLDGDFQRALAAYRVAEIV